MLLWNDYEGKTIAGVYSLGSLLRPEGRSALFALANGTDAPAMIRLTEALNDESLMLACWGRVSEVEQENLLKIKSFGETTFEGTPLTYAVLEQTDANLADLLTERPLTHPEAMQVATSVAAALTALHAKGLLHEHVDANNILAAGETVKLRTDCVRQCLIGPEHNTQAECLEFMKKDVQDFGTLLLYGLTLDKKLKTTTSLHAPFDKIIPHAINGTWGLAEISLALNPRPVKPLVPEGVVRSIAPVAENGSATRQAVAPVNGAARPVSAAANVPASAPLVPAAAMRQEPVPAAAVPHRRTHEEPVEAPGRSKAFWAACACVVLLLLAFVLHKVSGKSSGATQDAAAPVAAPVVTAPSNQASGDARPVAEQPAAPAPVRETASAAAAGTLQPGWYVIAYTYNRQDQALKRVASIMRRHASLHPQVISPNGRAPFLVSLGGAMMRRDAESVRMRARRSGLPRDTFVRNYEGG